MTKEKKVKTNPGYNNPWVYLPLLLVCAIVAGIFGETIMRTYLAKDIYSPYSYYNEINLSNLTAANPSLVIRDAKKVVVNHDVKISETISTVENSLIRVFEKVEEPALTIKAKEAAATDTNLVDYSSYYNLDKPLLLGLLVTTDGWAVASVDKDFSLKKEELVVIDISRKTYQISEILPVNADGLIFFRLAEANNLPVRNNISKSDFFLGQSLLSFASLNSVQTLSLTSLKEKEILSSDNPYLDLQLSVDRNNLKNNFIFNLAGDLAMIVNNEAKLIPAFFYNYQWQSFLSSTLVEKPLFGVNYLNLKNVKIASKNFDLNKGALLFSDGKVPAVVPGSVAEKAGLKEHDIITWINNKEVGVDGDLAELINSYKVGDKIKISYLRGGLEFSVDALLEEAATKQKDSLLK